MLTQTTTGRSCSAAMSQAFSAPGSTPITAFKTSTAASATRRPAAMSPTKSAYPGVSITFTRQSFQSKWATARFIEIFLSISSSV